MLYIIPIEPLEERYSAQWLEWTKKYLADNDIDSFHIINPESSYNKITQGAFLDVIGTNVYKNQQMQTILTLFKLGSVKDGDIFWFHDMWFPGLEMLAYIRDALGMKFKIYGCLHAGTYDPHDFLTKKGMVKWAKYQEEAWFALIDGIFVATEFHRQLISQSRAIPIGKIHITGFPMYPDKFMKGQKQPTKREDIIVFPHRLDEEKRPDLFDNLKAEARMQTTWGDRYGFIKTKEECKTKEEYYKVLRRAKFAVSFARQETWGIAMQEAVLCGCIPIVPNKLSYRELYLDIFRFNGPQEALERLHFFITNEDSMGFAYFDLGVLQTKFIEQGRTAFYNMFNIMFGE